MERNSILSIFLCNRSSQTIHIFLLAEFKWVRMSEVTWLGLTGSGLSGGGRNSCEAAHSYGLVCWCWLIVGGLSSSPQGSPKMA